MAAAPVTSPPRSLSTPPSASTGGQPGSGANPLRRLLAALAARRAARTAAGGTAKRALRTALLAGLVVLLALFAVSLAALQPASSGPRVGVDTVEQLAAAGRISVATLYDEDNRLTVLVGPARAAVPGSHGRAGTAGTSVAGVPDTGGRATLLLPSAGTLTARVVGQLADAGTRVRVDPQTAKRQLHTVAEFLLPVLILADLFALLFTAGAGSSAIGEVVSFGSVSDARTGTSAVTFASVGGADEAVVELAEVRDYLRDPARYRELGAAPPKGVLLFGPPGTGKTLLARAVAGEAGVPFFSVAGAEFVESLVGVGAARVRDLFRRVRAVAPAIVFIDELDAAGRRRGGGAGGGSDEREQTLNQLLVEMDGFDVTAGIVVIAATNRPDILDPALMRPGRFDRHITVERPDADGRERILRIHAGSKPLDAGVDFARLARRTAGFTGADLANVVNEAALLTIRGGRRVITAPTLDEAVSRVLNGPQRRGRLLTTEERRRAAVHEMGHVVVTAALGRAADVHRVSILARGRSVATTTLVDAEASLLTRSALRSQLVSTVAGLAAEELVLGEGSTGAEDDLEHATGLARDMVARYGMSTALGPVRLLARAGDGFLGELPPLSDLSPATHAALEAEIRSLIDSARDTATALLHRHRPQLDRLTALLDEHETLEDEALAAALQPLQQELADRATSAASTPRSRRPAADGAAAAGAAGAARTAPRRSTGAAAAQAPRRPQVRAAVPGAGTGTAERAADGTAGGTAAGTTAGTATAGPRSRRTPQP